MQYCKIQKCSWFSKSIKKNISFEIVGLALNQGPLVFQPSALLLRHWACCFYPTRPLVGTLCRILIGCFFLPPMRWEHNEVVLSCTHTFIIRYLCILNPVYLTLQFNHRTSGSCQYNPQINTNNNKIVNSYGRVIDSLLEIVTSKESIFDGKMYFKGLAICKLHD